MCGPTRTTAAGSRAAVELAPLAKDNYYILSSAATTRWVQRSSLRQHPLLQTPLPALEAFPRKKKSRLEARKESAGRRSPVETGAYNLRFANSFSRFPCYRHKSAMWQLYMNVPFTITLLLLARYLISTEKKYITGTRSQ